MLIRVYAVTVGRTLDVEVRARGADFRAPLPRILGSDPAGIVEAVGSEVTGFRPGDRVVCTSTLFCGRCAFCRAGLTNACVEHRVVGVHVDGGYAEHCAVPEGTVAHVPNHVTLEQASSMGVNYPVAWNLLARAGHLGPADWKLERCQALLGADQSVNYTLPQRPRRVRESSADGLGVAVVYENIASPELFGDALATLRPYGRLVTSGAHGGAGEVPVSIRSLYRRHLTIVGDTGATDAQTREVFQMVADRRLEAPPVSHRFGLAEVAAAHEAASGRALFGRAVLVVREESPGAPDRV